MHGGTWITGAKSEHGEVGLRRMAPSASMQGGQQVMGERARLLRERERVARDGVLDGGQLLVEILDVRPARLLVRFDRREGVRQGVVPRVQIGHDLALVIEPQAVLVATETLQHGGHHQLTSEKRHEACAGRVMARVADVRGDLLAGDG